MKFASVSLTTVVTIDNEQAKEVRKDPEDKDTPKWLVATMMDELENKIHSNSEKTTPSVTRFVQPRGLLDDPSTTESVKQNALGDDSGIVQEERAEVEDVTEEPDTAAGAETNRRTKNNSPAK